jgi:hypothetical protein
MICMGQVRHTTVADSEWAEGTFAPPKRKERDGGGVFRSSIKHISIHSFAC